MVVQQKKRNNVQSSRQGARNPYSVRVPAPPFRGKKRHSPNPGQKLEKKYCFLTKLSLFLPRLYTLNTIRFDYGHATKSTSESNFLNSDRPISVRRFQFYIRVQSNI